MVFADPPYDLTDVELWRELSPIESVLADDGLLVVERPRRREAMAAPDWLEQAFAKTWGDTQVTGYRLRSPGPT